MMEEEQQQRAAPDTLMRRLQLFRWQYGRGLISPARFKEILAQFRFKDDYGRTWVPGANSSNWYLWEGGRWSAYDPPPLLTLPTDAERFALIKAQQPSSSAAGQRPSPPAAGGSVYCTNCGKQLSQGARFCDRCGKRVT